MSKLLQPSRRGFLRGVGALLAAPAIVRASSLMAISPLPKRPWYDPIYLFDEPEAIRPRILFTLTVRGEAAVRAVSGLDRLDELAPPFEIVAA
jgi:hypothetical protein